MRAGISDSRLTIVVSAGVAGPRARRRHLTLRLVIRDHLTFGDLVNLTYSGALLLYPTHNVS